MKGLSPGFESQISGCFPVTNLNAHGRLEGLTFKSSNSSSREYISLFSSLKERVMLKISRHGAQRQLFDGVLFRENKLVPSFSLFVFAGNDIIMQMHIKRDVTFQTHHAPWRSRE